MTRRLVRRLLLAVTAAAASAVVFSTVGGATIEDTAPVNTAPPAISDSSPSVGESLRVSTGSWSGTTPMTYTYQWIRCDGGGGSCAAISGATSLSYTVPSGDAGYTLYATVTATNSAGSGGGSSPLTSKISSTSGTAPSNTKAPELTGTLQVGQKLTVSTGTWSGTTPISYSYQWQRCNAQGVNCAAFQNTSSNTYTLTSADQGNRLQVWVTASNSGGSASKYSNQTGQIGSNVAAPQNTAAPQLTGTLAQGQTLKVSTGSWSGPGPITVSFQWQRCNSSGTGCVPIGGATGQAYVLTSSDVGHKLQVLVTARNTGGTTAKYSNQSGVIAASTGAISGVVSAKDVNLPTRLVIDKMQYPNGGHSRIPFTARFHVSDTAHHSVSGALVYVVGLPYHWIGAVPEQATDGSGWVTLTINPTKRMPRSTSLVMFVRARTPQGDVLTGASTRRLVQVHIRP